MAKVDGKIVMSAVWRFVRVTFYTLVTYAPMAALYLSGHPELAALISGYAYWAIPALSAISGFLVATDKFIRDITTIKR